MLEHNQINLERKKGRMGTPETQLASFIAKYTPEIAALAEAILNRMRKLYPTAVEIVYDNYNALAIGFGPSDRASEVIFSITLYPKMGEPLLHAGERAFRSLSFAARQRLRCQACRTEIAPYAL